MTAATEGGTTAADDETARRGQIAAALHRFESILQRRPGAGLVDDSPAVTHWVGGTRFVLQAADGTQAWPPSTDIPEALGGQALGVPPGWLLRAALVTCLGTCIVLGAAAAGVALCELQLCASSRSDVRGLLGLADAVSADPVNAAPLEYRLQVRIGAAGAAAERLRALVAESQRRSPVSCALQGPVQLSVQVVQVVQDAQPAPGAPSARNAGDAG
jgi:organic hydroperoxide reductase OsmC/OhrA